MAAPEEEKAGLEAIYKLKSTDPPLFLAPNSDLSYSARIASQYLFTSLKPYTPKSPFDKLHTDGFDAEQIWQQIDLQSQPLLTSLQREIRRFEKNPDQILKLFRVSDANGVLDREIEENGEVSLGEDSEDSDKFSDDYEDEEKENGELEDLEDDEDEDEDEDEEEDEDEDEDEDMDETEEEDDGVPEVEDDFLKIKELEKYLVKEEEREYGSEKKKDKKGKKKKQRDNVEDDDDAEDENEEGDEDGDELLMFGEYAGDEDDNEDNIRYEDFFVPEKKVSKRKQKRADRSDDWEMEVENVHYAKDSKMKAENVDNADDSEMEDKDDADFEMDDDNDKQNKANLSTYEREREKLQEKIKQMEAENLAPKDWTMMGEISASKRPMDSALEVDLDFEHNVRPPPVITEEVTASLEEIIKKRIVEGRFDDVQKAPKLPSAAPRETKELDDNKSKKGLAEIYEEEYAQQTGFISAPLSVNDGLKKEASDLFKRLCLKLDALSHFHFAPKPVIEDMSIQNNVPALAMEEIAPIAVSDAAMLAPEEVFSGKGNIKEENELTKDDRKKRRARKKRKFKAINAKRAASKAVEKPSQINTEGKEE